MRIILITQNAARRFYQPKAMKNSARHFPSVKVLCTPPRRALVAIAVLSAVTASAQAEEVVVSDVPVVVTATRTTKTLDEAPSSIEVVDGKTLEREQPKTIGDALLDIPNVDVTAGESPVFTNVQIRGSDPDQITYLVDGVRQDNYTTSGNRPAFIFVDPELVKQVEVRRGGGSSLYGNGGIGGTLAVTTKSASDMLKPGQQFGAKLKTGYSDDSREWSKSAYVYGKADIYDAVVAYSRRDGGKIKSSKDGHRSNTPRDSQYDAFMAKVTAAPSADNKFSLGYALDKPSQWTGKADDRSYYDLKQQRITGGWDFKTGDLVDLKLKLQYTKMENSFDNRTYTPEAYFSDTFESYSGNVQNTSVFELGGVHAVTYGFDLSQTRQKAKDVNGAEDLTRPHSKGLDAGVFIQDEYSITDSVSLTPVLRYSYYDRKPQTNDNAYYGLESRHDSKLTPGITLTFSPTDSFSAYASVQSGYRPPMLDELYTSMSMYDGMIHSVVLPNSNVKPEESLNFEVGVNGDFKNLAAADDRLSVKVAVFRDKVKNLIVAGLTGDSDMTDDGMVLYYSIDNVGSALKTGFEASADYYIGDFDLHASYGYLHAKNEETGEEIPGLTPQQFTFRAGYTYKPWDFNAWYRLRAYKGGKSSEETSWNSGEYKTYAGFATHAVGFEWTPKVAGFADFAVNFAVDNVTNAKYQYLNGGYGTARTFRTWVSAQF